MDTLVDKIRRGDRRSLAQAMSLVDSAQPGVQALKECLRQSTGQVPWWGFTGPPGVGKSTLIDTLLSMLRRRGCRIGVVAVDPTSPISNGALLGDRVRMMGHAVDEDVFIRSLATHRCEGGLSDATLHCARLLELAGYDPVLIETVGVGQNEVDIASVADICVVILGPGYGDDVQLIKAGLLEIADIVVVNKCDLPGANRLLAEVRQELGLSPGAESIRHPGSVVACGPRKQPGFAAARVEIIGVEARSGKGVDQLLDRLLEIDLDARGVEERERHEHDRVIGEIKRSAMLRFEQVLQRELSTEAGKQLLARLERGELCLDSVVGELCRYQLSGRSK